ncbi:exodeoxyribonuclease III [Futiania mangrovi]|uniref:Exodeoxyribonuclease III n=1 Tax=Futiania mangrovi TaxID=2959716 RepID=A0A9J6PE21_9PROT|nr:exodeoxyribonuclease III [Futiania mangrovii]MCP1335987.1 exodeoxyribonuclease III [Futiania mangrovii]
MTVATWNVNSIKARLENVLAWFDEAKPDVACLQELKCVDEAFPREAFEERGYTVETHGQKTYNGVALLSRFPLEDVVRGLPGFQDEQARYIEALVAPKGMAPVRVAGAYMPNGNPVGTEKFTYKLAWLSAFEAHVKNLLAQEEACVFAGDYNIIPEPRDCHDPKAWEGDALFQPESRAAYRRLLNLGLTDAVRACDLSDGLYTFWDYQGGAWQKNRGIRIDHLLLSPQAADRLDSVAIHKTARGREKPSDHVPVTAMFHYETCIH